MRRIADTPVGGVTELAPAERVATREEPPDGADAADERPVCRICLNDDGDSEAGVCTLRCACRGGLRWVHPQCADAWFASRGTTTCEICKAGPAWQPSESALQLAARRRAASQGARHGPHRLFVPGASADADPVVFRPGALELDAESSRRVRLIIANICVLLALAFFEAFRSLSHLMIDHGNDALILFAAFCFSAMVLSAMRGRLVMSLTPFANRMSVAGLTAMTVVALFAFLYRQRIF